MFGEENQGNGPRTSPVPSSDPDGGHWLRLLKQVCGYSRWRRTLGGSAPILELQKILVRPDRQPWEAGQQG